MIFSKEIAYSIDVPDKVLSPAKVTKLGGMTYKSKNLWSHGDIVSTGYTYYVGWFLERITPNEQYALTWKYSSNGTAGTQNAIIIYTEAGVVTITSGIPFTITEAQMSTVQGAYAYFGSDMTSGSMTEIMLNEGEPKPYEPYYEGLRSAKVTEVKSVGVNLILFPYATPNGTYNGVTFTANADGAITVVGTPSKSFEFLLCEFYGKITDGVYTISGSKDNVALIVNKTSTGSDYLGSWTNTTFECSDDITAGSCYLYVESGATVNTTIYPKFNKGSTDQPYTPYVEHTLPIPEEVRPANGINENVYDFIEWAEDGSVKKTVKCGVVNMGTLNVTYNSSVNRFEVIMPENYKKPTTEKERYHLLCALYTPNQSPVYGDYIDKTISGYNNSRDVYINDSSYTDAATFKAAMSGVMLVYELATPIVTDISDLITADNLVPVQSGGTLTFENEYGYAVPSEVEYTRASIENYGRLIVDNLKKIGNYLGVQSDPQSTTNILTGMDSSALKSTNSSNPARSSDILLNKEAYVNGVKVVGSLELEAEEIVPDGYYDTSDATISVESILKGYVGYGKSGRMIGTYEPPSYVERDSDDLFDGEENGCIVLNVPYGLYRDGAKWVLPREVVYTSLAIGEFPISADFVAEGLVGYVNGERIEGNLPFRQEEDIAVSVLNGNIRAEVPRGYYSEDYRADLKGKYIDTTVLDVGVTSSDIAAGKVAFVNGALITGDATVRSDSDLTLKIADGNGNVSVEVPNGIYYNHISKIFEDTSTFKLRNTAYKLEGDFASSSKLLRGYVAYANGEMLYGAIDSNGSDAITTDVVDGKVTVNVSGGYYDGDMTHELPDTMADVSDASEVDPLEIPKGLVVYGLGETKLEGLYTKYYANKVTGNADVFKSTDISIRPTLFDDGRYGMALYDGFYSDARAILPSTNWVDTSAGDLCPITEDLILSSYVGYVDGKKIIGSMAYNTGDSVHLGISNNTTLSPTTVTVSVTVDKGFYEIDTPKSLTLRPGIVDSAVLPYGATVFADNTAILKGRAAYANGKVLVGTMDYYAYGYGYSVERNAGGKRVNYVVERGYHEGGASILDDVIMYTDGENGTLYSHSNENDDDGLWYSNALAKGITACANGEVIHGTSTYYYGKSLFIDFTDPVIPDGIYSDSRVYIPGGFVDTSDATISAVRYGDTWISEHVVSGKTVYARGVKVIGTRPSEDTLTWYDGDFGATILDDETTYAIELYDRSDMANNRTRATVYTAVDPTIYDNGIVYLKDPYDPNTLRAFMIVVDRTNNNPTLMLYHVLSAFPDELYEVDVSGYGYRYARISMY